jgi:hypothetical protein
MQAPPTLDLTEIDGEGNKTTTITQRQKKKKKKSSSLPGNVVDIVLDRKLDQATAGLNS